MAFHPSGGADSLLLAAGDKQVWRGEAGFGSVGSVEGLEGPRRVMQHPVPSTCPYSTLLCFACM
eukprot:235277-Chlamydomonas_euryale.AAC.1